MFPSPSLAELQRWMRWTLTHPLGVRRAIAGERLVSLPGRFEPPEVNAVPAISSEASPGRTAEDRLSVYGSGYFSRLHGTLQLEFPRLEAALGEDGFRTLVAAHLLRTPSTSPSLADLGEGLADTLRALPVSGETPWLVDLATLERATAEVWLSGAPGVTGAALDAAEDWEQLRLALAPTARLLPLEWDVAGWEPAAGAPPGRQGRLVVWRVEASTGAEWLDPAPGALLEAVAAERPLGEVGELAAALEMSAAEVTAAFAHWSARGWLVRARPASRDG